MSFITWVSPLSDEKVAAESISRNSRQPKLLVRAADSDEEVWADDSSSGPHQHRLTVLRAPSPSGTGQDASWPCADPEEGSSHSSSTWSVVN